jgi:hypothetical protein
VDSWYPSSIASGTPLAEPRKIKGGAVTLLVSLGYSAHDALDDISVRGATATEAELLNLSTGAPVIVVFRTVASSGDPVEFDLSYYPADIAAGTDLAAPGKIKGGAPESLPLSDTRSVTSPIGYPCVCQRPRR